jgi:hypothetical protein
MLLIILLVVAVWAGIALATVAVCVAAALGDGRAPARNASLAGAPRPGQRGNAERPRELLAA